MSFARTLIFTTGCLVIVGCFGGCDEDEPNYFSQPPPDVNIDGYWPCIVAPGGDLTIFGRDFMGADRAFVGGNEATIVSKTNIRMVLRTAAATSNGQINLFQGPKLIAKRFNDPPTIGTEVIVPEVEPNDDINGSNATPMGKNREARGVLSSPTDADHFLRDCFHPGSRYRITITPPGLPVIYVDGVPVTLTAGQGTFTPTRDKALFGLTAGIGAYKITVDLVSF